MGGEHISPGRPTWFGPLETSLFGVVHTPDNGLARAGVVICPPLGKEHLDSYRGLKLLAQRLCARGFAVLRFDYAGTGDSAIEQDDPAAVARYLESIHTAVGYLRDAGVPDIALVGLRAGALLAGLAADSIDGVAALVLWDPVTDGRRYLREQRALYTMTVGDEPGAGPTQSILGCSLAVSAAERFKALKLPTAFDPGLPVLVTARPERAGDAAIAALEAAPNVAVRTVAGQAEFVEPASFVVEIPVGSLYAIAAWLDETLTASRCHVAPVVRTAATVSPGVRETLEFLGPDRLFAIRSTPTELAPDAPALLIHNTACEHRVGPGRVWVETARELAATGMTVLRYDRRGIGETGYATTDFARLHSGGAKADVVHAMDATGVPADRLMMAGVCSGAWDSAYGALTRGARSVVMVNLLTFSLRKVEVGPEELSGPQTGAAEVRAKQLIRRWLPYRLWLLIGWLGLTEVPEILLAALHRAGVSVDLVLSPEDFAWFDQQRGRRGVRRLSRRGWSERVVAADGGDHSLLQRGIQNSTRERVRAVAEREFTPLLPAHADWRTEKVACRGSQL
ncbi:alpha/beta hydrolase [Mycolicibacterium diernhoferi]|uniref:Serine aminopeptidase S33 domain-containing protein n=1 Tax=Mycolicibacterium diernhoferi TaxID=1801 RepID=A0A1Q4HCN9_9MYCO|nr:alpha/beta hydrolase [Mycolicibacterium diernhoferi]OJZ65225.1 hypothetical protein BRW64_15565 [Mycolicibacterium diernhoferi]PEG55162.1 hypothetical protein CRI78_08170 [Mycolicibacterium diernhoferi]QYL23553.1 alpha/beta hydrolase [Mycolicibacterium diernhoferi]